MDDGPVPPRTPHLVWNCEELEGEDFKIRTHRRISAANAQTPNSSRYQYKSWEGDAEKLTHTKKKRAPSASTTPRHQNRPTFGKDFPVPDARRARYPRAPMSERSRVAPACRMTDYPLAIKHKAPFCVVTVGNVPLTIQASFPIRKCPGISYVPVTGHRQHFDIPRGWQETTRKLRGEKPRALPTCPRRVRKTKSAADRTRASDTELFSPRWHKSGSKKQSSKRQQRQKKKGEKSERMLHEAAPHRGAVAENGGAWDSAEGSSSPSRRWQCSDKFFYEPESVLRVQTDKQDGIQLSRYPDMSSSQCSTLNLSKGVLESPIR